MGGKTQEWYDAYSERMREVDRWLETKFHALGEWIAERPLRTIGCVVLLAVVMACGLAVAPLETDNDVLWTPTGTVGKRDSARFEEVWGVPSGGAWVIMHVDEGENVATLANLLDLLDMHNRIVNATVQRDGRTVDYEDICHRRVGLDACVYSSVLSIWDYSEETLRARAAHLRSDMYEHSQVMYDTCSVTDASFDHTTRTLVGTRSCLNAYELSGEANATLEADRKEWELDAFAHAAEDFHDEADGYGVLYGSDELFNEALTEAIGGDIMLYVVALVIMSSYAALVLGRRNRVESSSLLALGGVFSTLLSVLAGFGFAGFVQIPLTPLTPILPFLLLGIGLDDMFIIVESQSHVDQALPIGQRIGRGLSRAGVSITLTSITDAVAFALSASTSIPGVRYFAGYACICIIFDFAFQVTMFVAFLVLDQRRKDKNHTDCCSCMCAPPPPREDAHGVNKPHVVSEFMRTKLGPALNRRNVKIGVIVGFTAFFAVSCWASTQVELDWKSQDLFPAGHHLADFLDHLREEYQELSYLQLYVIMPAPTVLDYGREDVQVQIQVLSGELRASSSINTNVDFVSWVEEMTAFGEAHHAGEVRTVNAPNHAGETTAYKVAPADKWHAWVVEMLTEHGDTYAHLRPMFFFDNADPVHGVLRSTRLQTAMKADSKPTDQASSMNTVRDIVDAYHHTLTDAYAFASDFVWLESWAIFVKETIQTLALAAVGCLLITMVVLVDPRICVLLLVIVVYVDVDIMFAMYALDLRLNTTTVIALVMAIGFVVDYGAHIVASFMEKAGTRERRTVFALTEVGGPVMNGAMTTMLGVCVLMGSASGIFKALARMLFSFVFFGALHGLVLLPVLMSLWGPPSHRLTEKDIANRGTDDLATPTAGTGAEPPTAPATVVEMQSTAQE